MTFDVRSFGAKGDGATDDTASIRAAIKAASPSGGTVLLPPGTYITSGTLTLASHVTLSGHGRVSIVKATNTAYQVVTVPANTLDWGVRNLAIQGAATDGVRVTHAGIYAYITERGESGDGVVDGVTFLNANDAGVSAAVKIERGNPNCVIQHCRILGLYGIPAGTGYGVLALSDNTAVLGNIFEPPVGQGRNAVYLSGTATTGAAGCRVIGNRFVGFTNVVIASNSGGSGLRQTVIADNLITDHAPRGDTMGAIGLYGACDTVSITGNIIESIGTRGVGITVQGSADITSCAAQQYITITSNVIRNVGGDGIAIIGLDARGAVPAQYPREVSVVANLIASAGAASPKRHAAIKVAQASQIHIVANRVNGGSAITLYGLLVTSTPPAATGCVVVGNTFDAVSAAEGHAISDDGTGTSLFANTQDGLQLLASPVLTPASTPATAGLRLPQGVLPTSPLAGDIVFDGTHFRGYNGSAWKQLDN